MTDAVNWPNTFSPSEWPGDTASKIKPATLNALFQVRELSGIPMTPTPLERGHIREETGTSRHQAPNHDATDLFLLRDDIATFLQAAQEVPELKGIGIYLDRNLRGRTLPLVHLDTRPGRRILWIQEGPGKPYIYSNSDPLEYYRIAFNHMKKHL